MKTSTVIKRVLIGLGAILALLFGRILIDRSLMSAARPPENLQTLEEFKAWKQGEIHGQGTFQHSGVTYTVLLAPAGRILCSGPSAYLFDEEGRFVDWTSDMGDFYTVKNRFELMGGNVKNITHEKP